LQPAIVHALIATGILALSVLKRKFIERQLVVLEA